MGAVVAGLSRFTSSANGWTVLTNLHHITITIIFTGTDSPQRSQFKYKILVIAI